MKPLNSYGLLGAAALLSSALPALADSTYSYQITADTYIDYANSAKNYGAAGSDKVVFSTTPCNTLFDLPSQLWSFSLADIQSVTVTFHLPMDNLSGTAINLFALTQGFVEGTGTSSTTTPADGATWNTSDGLNLWTTAGGAYDSSLSAVSVKGTATADGGYNYTWDITALVENATTYSELENNGALLTVLGTAPASQKWGSFTSSDSSSASSYGPFVTVMLVPEPSSLALFGLAGAGLFLTKRALKQRR